jgi:hypothetical protein
MAKVIGGIIHGVESILGLGGSSPPPGPAPEAQMLHNGNLVIQLDSQNNQIIFANTNDKKSHTIALDLKNGYILGASFPPPPPPTIPEEPETEPEIPI